jgi:hypothetical protein
MLTTQIGSNSFPHPIERQVTSGERTLRLAAVSSVVVDRGSRGGFAFYHARSELG